MILLKNLSSQTSETILEQTHKIFKIIVFFIVTNIAINEVFRGMDSNLWHEFKSEGSYLAFFYISFIVFYYCGALYEKITSNGLHKVIVSRYLMFVLFSTILTFQLDGILNPNHENLDSISYLALNDLALLFILFSILVIIQGIYLLKKKLIRWFDVFYYLIMTALLFFAIAMNGIVVLGINEIEIK